MSTTKCRATKCRAQRAWSIAYFIDPKVLDKAFGKNEGRTNLTQFLGKFKIVYGSSFREVESKFIPLKKISLFGAVN